MTGPKRLALLACILVAYGCLAGCRRTQDARAGGNDVQPWFEEVGARAGLSFVHRSGHEQRHFLPEIIGGGAALFDMDNDGLLDLYLVQSGRLSDPAGGSGNRLYHNRGNGTFEDVTDQSGAGIRAYGMGVTAGDFDNDGYTDLYITNLDHNVLLKNDGHGHFTDVTAKAGVASSGWSTSAAFDYDGNGSLDLFVVHYLNGGPRRSVFQSDGRSDYCSPRARSAVARELIPQQWRQHVYRRIRAFRNADRGWQRPRCRRRRLRRRRPRRYLRGQRPYAQSPLVEPGRRPLPRGGPDDGVRPRPGRNREIWHGCRRGRCGRRWRPRSPGGEPRRRVGFVLQESRAFLQ